MNDEDTIGVEIWKGRRDRDRDSDEVVQVPVDGYVMWEDDPYATWPLGLHIADEDLPATLYVYTDDSVREPPVDDPHEWNCSRPVEGGLPYQENGTEKPFGVELWGRIMFHVEEGLTR